MIGQDALPGGSFYENINPWLYIWLYNAFLQEEEDKQSFARSLAIFQGSFSNYEMARSIMKADTPTAEMDDEQFEAVSEFILNKEIQSEPKLKKRQRKLLNKK
jgi:hypothetical protein